jgi:hypothetical protein
VAEALSEPYLPFFLHRSRHVPDPGEGEDGGGIAWIEVSGDAARLADWLGGAALPVRVIEGSPAVRAMGIGKGRVIHGDGRMQVA